jgi:uncharacterized protein YyaL (SSP411 family)
MTTNIPPNRLIHETSPYLLQHAHNPVEWHPWGADALGLAQREDKPILLSIGYSACHWCHVMAHESFENQAIAEVMNRLFVNIKVDREERPDLDKIYQAAHHIIAQRGGGWPLTLFLNPHNQLPFFGGTYFPPTPRHGLPGFPQLLEKVADFYRDHRPQIEQQAHSIGQVLERLEASSDAGQVKLSPAPLDSALQQMISSVDWREGGFGSAPKFPHFNSIEFLLQAYQAGLERGAAQADVLDAALLTLRKMAMGGIYDHLGGGFCRYSTDDEWMIPHFEKMLYDNGPFVALYSRAWQLTGEVLFRRAACETAEWAIREMQSPEGGFYSSLDADSEGEEGKFYVWDRETVKDCVGEAAYPLLAAQYGLDRLPNFEGHWHLHSYQTREAVAKKFNLPLEQADEIVDAARQKLFHLRKQRVPPGRDDKILVSWNGLMIQGLASAALIFGENRYAEAASRAVEFIRRQMWRDGRLAATYKDGKAHLNAYLDDYAFLLDGLLALLQARWRKEDLEFAVELAEALLRGFEDQANGGFYFTSADHETLIQRPKPYADESMPSGNGVAALALSRLGHLLAEPRYLQASERAVASAWAALQQAPYAHISMAMALRDYFEPPAVVVLRGEAEILQDWQRVCASRYAPGRLCLAIPAAAQALPEALAIRQPQGEIVAYACRGAQCSPPLRELAEFRAELGL